MADSESPLEIERKFLLRGVPPVTGHPSVLIDQGYVPGKIIRERVRRMTDADGTRYVRTMKLGKGMVRREFEEATTPEIFAGLWALTEGRRLQKRRYFVLEGDLTWEIDVFTDRDLVLAELEVSSAEHAIVIPEWLKSFVVRDVTEEREYGNASLAR